MGACSNTCKNGLKFECLNFWKLFISDTFGFHQNITPAINVFLSSRLLIGGCGGGGGCGCGGGNHHWYR